MSTMSYDLRAQPWVLVRTLTGGVQEVSLREAFERADQLQGLFGEVPTQTIAVLRVLRAVLHRAVVPLPDPVQGWRQMWEQGLPLTAVLDYLDQGGERFDLLSATTPFMQVPDLAAMNREVKSVKPLLADVPNNEPFFTTRAGAATQRLSYAEAARWLVHCHAFDPSGIKSGARGDSRVKGGRGYPIGVGWAGNLGVVVVEGRTLRETLLLNLVPVHGSSEPLGDTDTPVWERPVLTAAVEGRAAPTGPADLYTWPSRRIRLVHDGADVTGVVLSQGDPLGQQDMFTETMTAWRRSKAQENELGRSPVYMPRTHDPERSVWRGLEGLLIDAGPAAAGPGRLRPLVLRWLDRLRTEDILAADMVFRTRAVGMVYGSNNSVVAEIVDDALTVQAVLLGDTGEVLRTAAVDAVTASELSVRALADLATTLARAVGGEPVGPRERAREWGYFALDQPYRSWLASLDAQTEPQTALTAWHRQAADLVSRLGEEAIEAAGTPAWVGRDLDGRHVNAGRAHLWFRRDLAKALPLAQAGRPRLPGPATSTAEPTRTAQ